MVALHTGVLLGCALEVTIASRPWIAALGFPMLLLFLGANAMRWWVIRTLGARWNVEVMSSSRLGVITACGTVSLDPPPKLHRRLCGNAGSTVDSQRLDCCYRGNRTPRFRSATPRHAGGIRDEPGPNVASGVSHPAALCPEAFVTRHDVIIAGAGPAGSSLAIQLARQGRSVLLHGSILLPARESMR